MKKPLWFESPPPFLFSSVGLLAHIGYKPTSISLVKGAAAKKTGRLFYATCELLRASNTRTMTFNFRKLR